MTLPRPALPLAAAALLVPLVAWGASPATEGLLARYAGEGATNASAASGQAMWTRTQPGPDGAPRSCATCHGADPRQAGKHATTGAAIEPLAPSVQPDRLTDAATIEKWFGRNCTWTWARACTPQEKADFLLYISSR